MKTPNRTFVPPAAPKDTKDQLKNISKNQPQQTKNEIFTNTTPEGFNNNPSAQRDYPGPQKHK